MSSASSIEGEIAFEDDYVDSCESVTRPTNPNPFVHRAVPYMVAIAGAVSGGTISSGAELPSLQQLTCDRQDTGSSEERLSANWIGSFQVLPASNETDDDERIPHVRMPRKVIFQEAVELKLSELPKWRPRRVISESELRQLDD